jgi:hypothetical protein
MTCWTPHTSRPLRFASGVRAEHLSSPFRFNANAVARLLVEADCALAAGRQRVWRGYPAPLAQQKGASGPAGVLRLANCPVSHGAKRIMARRGRAGPAAWHPCPPRPAKEALAWLHQGQSGRRRRRCPRVRKEAPEGPCRCAGGVSLGQGDVGHRRGRRSHQWPRDARGRAGRKRKHGRKCEPVLDTGRERCSHELVRGERGRVGPCNGIRGRAGDRLTGAVIG